jgi:hypothetical protein
MLLSWSIQLTFRRSQKKTLIPKTVVSRRIINHKVYRLYILHPLRLLCDSPNEIPSHPWKFRVTPWMPPDPTRQTLDIAHLCFKRFACSIVWFGVTVGLAVNGLWFGLAVVGDTDAAEVMVGDARVSAMVGPGVTFGLVVVGRLVGV